MNKTELDLSSLKKAIDSLARAVTKLGVVPDDEFIRDSCIQRFEYTYELCGKFLRLYLEITEPSSDIIEQMSFPTLIRTACERGLLLHDWSKWIEYRDKRNITSHTYDELKAAAVIQTIPSFLQEAQYLSARLEEKIAQ